MKKRILLSLVSMFFTSTVYAKCLFDANKPESINYKTACLLGENLAQIYKMDGISFEKASQICSSGFSNNEVKTLSNYSQSLSQYGLFYRKKLEEASSQGIETKNNLSAFCLKGFTDIVLSSDVQTTNKKLEPFKKFTGKHHEDGHIFGIGCKTTKDNAQKAIADGKSKCFEAGYTTCNTVNDTAHSYHTHTGYCHTEVIVHGIDQ